MYDLFGCALPGTKWRRIYRESNKGEGALLFIVYIIGSVTSLSNPRFQPLFLEASEIWLLLEYPNNIVLLQNMPCPHN